MNSEQLRQEVIRISGVNPSKCMRCGKCSATCPAYDEMEYHPHQFVSCFACIDRCPRSVQPAKLVEAVRLAAVRKQGANHLTPDHIPERINDDTPQQLLVSAMRKYNK